MRLARVLLRQTEPVKARTERRWPKPAAVLLTLAAGMHALFGQPLAGPKSGTNDLVVLSIEGKLEFSRQGTKLWDLSRTNQVLYAGDRLRTGERSRALLQFSNTQIRLEELSELLVPEETADRPVITLLKGLFYFFHRDKPGRYQLHTPTVSAIVRGTEFTVEVAQDGSSILNVLDGAAEVSAGAGPVEVHSKESLEVGPSGRPVVTALVNTVSVIQWCLYYPAVLDTDELDWAGAEPAEMQASLAAYRRGDILGALDACPPGRPPGSETERVYQAALLLAVGETERSRALLEDLGPESPLAEALRRLMAAVQFRRTDLKRPPVLASEWLAESYYAQSRASRDPRQLEQALKAARAAAAKAPGFGLAWVRVAELEFCFGRTRLALEALKTGLRLCPDSAQALALKGFLLAAQDRLSAATRAFEQALATDSGLANAWLGRGLCRIRLGHAEAGREDLFTAAALEPQRASLRSYLAKADANEALFTRDRELRRRLNTLAFKELALAREQDPFDPTPWLYSALMLYNEYRITDAIDDMEKSAQLNDNRQVYRSRLLLDEDQAVRSANLADIYKDVDMIDVSLAEAARAVSFDYASFSAHLNLASTFDALRDPTRFNLRYESEWFNEQLLASMLAPLGAVSLSQNLSQEEYSRLFAANAIGLESTSEFFSDKEYRQTATQYGTVGKTSWALDLDYEYRNGDRVNNDLSRIEWYSRIKQQITPEDSLFFLAKYEDYNSGDQFLYYDPSSARPAYRFTETQTPLLLAGWHHEEGPGMHTLFLAGRLENAQHVTDTNAPQLTEVVSPLSNPVNYVPFDVDYDNRFEIYTAELNQILQREKHTDVFGARVQGGYFKASALLDNPPAALASLFPSPETSTTDSSFWRLSAYEYHHWEIVDGLMLIGGLANDFEKYPANFRRPPLTSVQTDKYHFSPKAALVWNPVPKLTFRGVFSRALGGVSYDESVRLEPTQLAGFDQSFRSIISESLIGSVEAAQYQIAGGAVDWRIFPRTWLTLQGQTMSEQVSEDFGCFLVNFTPPAHGYPANTVSDYDYHETTFDLTLNQTVARNWFLQLRYQYSMSDLKTTLPAIPATPTFDRTADMRGDLGQLRPSATWQLPNGIFARGEVAWFDQFLSGSAFPLPGSAPAPPGRSFVQANLYGGYRFPNRRCDLTVGVLNLGGGDYHLSPINYYLELPHQRLFYARVRFNF